MKVEFIYSDVLGHQLFVAAPDFLKAVKNRDEYGSLARATEAFANLSGIEYFITEDEYDVVTKQLDKSGAVIFAIAEERYPTRSWVEIYVSNNNQLHRVMFDKLNIGKRQIKVRYNPDAVDTIRKRHEAEGKK
jgi:hypothetical protein